MVKKKRKDSWFRTNGEKEEKRRKEEIITKAIHNPLRMTRMLSIPDEILCAQETIQHLGEHHKFYGENNNRFVGDILTVACSELGPRLPCSILKYLTDCKVFLKSNEKAILQTSRTFT